jgi:predicted  nucleic acid-binding Zn-ribbon protein
MADDAEGYVCTECGRQQPTDMATCECGSASFRPLTERLTHECTECGTLVAKGVDSCPECGFRSFEQLNTGPTAGEVATGYMEWQCTECGRSHQRNNPPCKRCGSHSLERVDVDADDVVPTEFVDGRWYELDRPTIGLAVVAVLLIGVVGAGLLGVGPLAPDPPWTSTVETDALGPSVAEDLDETRQEEGAGTLTSDDALATAASDRASDLADGDGGEPVAERVTACDATGVDVGASADERPPGGDASVEAVAESLVSRALSDDTARSTLLDSRAERVGVGAAAAGGRLFVVVAVC